MKKKLIMRRILKKQRKIYIIFIQIDKKCNKTKDIPGKITWYILQRQETKHERE